MNQLGTIRMPESIHYGAESLEKLELELKRLGKKALIVTDQIMIDLGHVKKLQEILEESNKDSAIYSGVDAETKDTHVFEALKIYTENSCDFVIALGGGSCIDTAKACSVLVKNDEELINYVANKKEIIHEPVPVVAIPTTSGTGSEVTDAMVVTNTKLNIKMMIKQPLLMPKVAIVDPMLTLSAPKSLTVATGIDALSHGIEAYISRQAHPFTSNLALSAVKAIINHIKIVYEDGSNLEARTSMSLASMQAGSAFSNSSVTLVHGMSRPIGALFNVPHGISNAMLLVPVLEYSLPECIEELATIGREIDEKLAKLSDEEAAKETVLIIKRLCRDLEIPSLEEWGIDEQLFKDSLEKMATDALDSGSPANNPKIPSKEEILQLYKTCYSYEYK